MASHRKKPRASESGKAAYFNRELSWLAFNRRVLEQAQSDRHPLLERVRFLAIVSSNLDEFFELRVAGLMQQVDSGLMEFGSDGLTPVEQLRRIHSVVASMVEDQYHCWHHQLVPPLALEQSHPFPQLGNKALNVVVSLESPDDKQEGGTAAHVAILPVPRILP